MLNRTRIHSISNTKQQRVPSPSNNSEHSQRHSAHRSHKLIAKMGFRRVSSPLHLAQVAASKWELVQVELQGKYSPQRMRTFYAYSIQTRWYHILLWCIVTPIPSLVVNILLDVAPLASPSAGRDANYVFWGRYTVFAIIITYWAWIQIGHRTPALGMTRWHAVATAIVVTITDTAFLYIVAGLVAMPLPFVLITTTPLAAVSSMIMVAIFFGRRLKNDPALRANFNRALNINSLQLYLMFIYPAFIYGFNSIPSKYQTPYMTLVPLIKIIAKNIVSRFAGSNDDLKSVEIIFNIDCFNAIYVSLVMQQAATISTSLIVILIDVIQGCVSVYDVYQRFQPLKQFMKGLPSDHPLYGKNFLEVAIALDQEHGHGPRKDQISSTALTNSVLDIKLAETRKVSAPVPRASSAKVFVAPPEAGTLPNSCDMQLNLGSFTNQAGFVLATTKLLFTTELVLLVEYTEVIMPVFYSLLMAATYFLPNRASYSTIADIDEHELWTMVTNVLMYAALELASLIVMDLVLRCITGVSPIRQVGFVLDKQCMIVQSKLLSWVLYAVQNSLEHFGADYSFRFKWLHSD